jgi:hypothetical protein
MTDSEAGEKHFFSRLFCREFARCLLVILELFRMVPAASAI